MSSAASTESAAPTLLVVKPVIATDTEPGVANVLVKLARRREQAVSAPPGRGTVSQAGSPGMPRRRSPAAGVVALDPLAAEHEVVGLLSSKVAQAVLEVLSGIRSVQQLARWLDTRCLSALTTRARLHAEACKAHARRQSHDGSPENVRTLHHQPIVRSVHCSNISPGVYENVVIMADKTRFRAVAMRFERERGLWKVTALNIG